MIILTYLYTVWTVEPDLFIAQQGNSISTKETHSFLPSWSHPQLWITDLERPLTFFMIMILLSQHTEFPFVGKILRLQSSRLD